MLCKLPYYISPTSFSLDLWWKTGPDSWLLSDKNGLSREAFRVQRWVMASGCGGDSHFWAPEGEVGIRHVPEQVTVGTDDNDWRKGQARTGPVDGSCTSKERNSPHCQWQVTDRNLEGRLWPSGIRPMLNLLQSRVSTSELAEVFVEEKPFPSLSCDTLSSRAVREVLYDWCTSSSQRPHLAPQSPLTSLHPGN